MSYAPSPARLRRPGPALALLALGHLIISLDLTIVFVALPHIAADVGFTAHTQQWVVSVYAVLYGGFLLLGGRLGFGHRSAFRSRSERPISGYPPPVSHDTFSIWASHRWHGIVPRGRATEGNSSVS